MLLALGVATSTLANCMALPAVVQPSEMACCSQGHDACPMHRMSGQSAADCCQHNTQRQQALTVAEQHRLHTFAVVFQALTAVFEHPTHALRHTPDRFGRDHAILGSPPSPRPSLSTVLLI